MTVELSRLCSIKIVTDLWNNENIWRNIDLGELKLYADFDNFYDSEAEVERNRQSLLQSVKKYLDELTLPERLKQDLAGLIEEIGEEIFIFIDSFQCPEKMEISLPQDLVWCRLYGTINWTKTFYHLFMKGHDMRSGLFDEIWFDYACINCSEETITYFWNNIVERNWQEGYMERLKRFSSDDARLALQMYWVYKLNNDSSMLLKLESSYHYNKNDSLDTNMFVMTARTQHMDFFTSSCYFLQKIKSSDVSVEQQLASFYQRKPSCRIDCFIYRQMIRPTPFSISLFLSYINNDRIFSRFFKYVQKLRHRIYPTQCRILERLILEAPRHLRNSDYLEISENFIKILLEHRKESVIVKLKDFLDATVVFGSVGVLGCLKSVLDYISEDDSVLSKEEEYQITVFMQNRFENDKEAYVDLCSYVCDLNKESIFPVQSKILGFLLLFAPENLKNSSEYDEFMVRFIEGWSDHKTPALVSKLKLLLESKQQFGSKSMLNCLKSVMGLMRKEDSVPSETEKTEVKLLLDECFSNSFYQYFRFFNLVCCLSTDVLPLQHRILEHVIFSTTEEFRNSPYYEPMCESFVKILPAYDKSPLSKVKTKSET